MTARKYYPTKDPEPERSFSSTQVNLTGRAAETVRSLAAKITNADLTADGREDEPHVTVKYGLHFQSPTQKLRDALMDFGPVSLTLGKTSLFKNPDFDVLKVDVDSPDLHRLNALVSRVVPTHDTHPVYKPHCTVAYLKPGRGKKYAGDTALAGQKMMFDAVRFSGRKGKIEMLPLGHPAPAPYRVR